VSLLKRISAWRRGWYREPRTGGVDDPPVCACGHARSVHRSPRCGGWARDQWLTIGRLRWDLRCRCKGMP
jgi:hypothetical protein